MRLVKLPSGKVVNVENINYGYRKDEKNYILNFDSNPIGLYGPDAEAVERFLEAEAYVAYG